MKNKYVGLLIIGLSLLIGFIIVIFNKAMKNLILQTCTHGSSCSMWVATNVEKNISLGIMILVLLIGLYILFFVKDPQSDIKIKKINKKSYLNVLSELSKEEKLIFEIIIDSNGSIYQSSLVNKTKLTKVKITRILDKLEGQNLIERKRRGMTNIVILKHHN